MTRGRNVASGSSSTGIVIGTGGVRKRTMICLREQHLQSADLVDVERHVRVNLEYDMKRCPVKVRDFDDIVAAETVPWRTIDEFFQAREQFDLWRRSRRRVLRTAADHADFQAWALTQPAKRRVGSTGDRPAFGRAVPPCLDATGARPAWRILPRTGQDDE